MTTCAQCNFVYEEHSAETVAEEIRHIARLLRDRLGSTLMSAEGLAKLRHRTEPERWSALEYAAHVRDVLLAERDRVFRALVEERPIFTSMHREERCLLGRYNEEDPATTGTELTLAADLFAWAVGSMSEEQWGRLCIYRWPNQTTRTLRWVGQHTLHEALHHLGDVDEVLAQS